VTGIEARQRSTPTFIEKVQRECLERFDATRSPEAVLTLLRDAIDRLHAGEVPIEDLVERNRVSKPLERYTQNTQNVAALKRTRDQDLAVHPGQDIEYVVDDEKNSRERVALGLRDVEDGRRLESDYPLGPLLGWRLFVVAVTILMVTRRVLALRTLFGDDRRPDPDG